MTEATGIARKSLWTRARDMAAQAPPERNRQVDFLRALSILAVVVGHWLVRRPLYERRRGRGRTSARHPALDAVADQGGQVMPLFFLVGGLSLGMSLAATLRKGGGPWMLKQV
ncbi:hypothetical protein GCM10009115_27720 [Sphingopyxis soli]|uniref:Acyltransferase n=1 Tax=Sphingopyxis soli TaxID=592051 RepID=A0ABP3XP47_9SPHN|nr:acyltransferase [Sphingopyxis soli]